MRHSILRSAVLAAAAVLTLTIPFPSAARAAERPAPLPESVAAHVAFRSPARGVEEIFTFIDAATKDTANHIPSEFLLMMLGAYLPVPFDAWDAAEPLHLVFLDDEELHTMVVVFSHDGFPALLAGLADADWDVPEKALENEDENLFAEVRMVAMANGTPMFLADLGDGRAVLAEDIGAARRSLAAGGLDLARAADADIAARIRLDDMDDVSGDILDAITGGADAMIKTVAAAGLTEETGKWMLDAAMKYGERIGAELESAEEILVTLDFGEAVLSAAANVRFADGSWTEQWAKMMEGAQARPESAFAAVLPEGAFTLAVTAPPDEVLPGAESMTAELLSALAAIAPEQKDVLSGFAERLFAAGPGATAGANYLNGGRPYQLAVTEFADAQAALDAVLSLEAPLSGIMERAFAEKSESLRIAAETHEADGREYREWKFEPADAEKFAGFIERLNEMSGDDGPHIAFDPDFRIFAARLENPEALAVLTGLAGNDEFAAILQDLAEKAAAGDAASPFDAPEAKESVAALGAAQFSLGLAKAEGVSTVFALRFAEEYGETLPPAAFDAPEQASPPAVFGLGVDNGRVTMCAVTPAAAVNAGIRTQERVSALKAEAALAERKARNEARNDERNDERNETEQSPGGH